MGPGVRASTSNGFAASSSSSSSPALHTDGSLATGLVGSSSGAALLAPAFAPIAGMPLASPASPTLSSHSAGHAFTPKTTSPIPAPPPNLAQLRRKGSAGSGFGSGPASASGSWRRPMSPEGMAYGGVGASGSASTSASASMNHYTANLFQQHRRAHSAGSAAMTVPAALNTGASGSGGIGGAVRPAKSSLSLVNEAGASTSLSPSYSPRDDQPAPPRRPPRPDSIDTDLLGSAAYGAEHEQDFDHAQYVLVNPRTYAYAQPPTPSPRTAHSHLESIESLASQGFSSDSDSERGHRSGRNGRTASGANASGSGSANTNGAGGSNGRPASRTGGHATLGSKGTGRARAFGEGSRFSWSNSKRDSSGGSGFPAPSSPISPASEQNHQSSRNSLQRIFTREEQQPPGSGALSKTQSRHSASGHGNANATGAGGLGAAQSMRGFMGFGEREYSASSIGHGQARSTALQGPSAGTSARPLSAGPSGATPGTSSGTGGKSTFRSRAAGFFSRAPVPSFPSSSGGAETTNGAAQTHMLREPSAHSVAHSYATSSNATVPPHMTNAFVAAAGAESGSRRNSAIAAPALQPPPMPQTFDGRPASSIGHQSNRLDASSIGHGAYAAGAGTSAARRQSAVAPHARSPLVPTDRQQATSPAPVDTGAGEKEKSGGMLGRLRSFRRKSKTARRNSAAPAIPVPTPTVGPPASAGAKTSTLASDSNLTSRRSSSAAAPLSISSGMTTPLASQHFAPGALSQLPESQPGQRSEDDAEKQLAALEPFDPDATLRMAKSPAADAEDLEEIAASTPAASIDLRTRSGASGSLSGSGSEMPGTAAAMKRQSSFSSGVTTFYSVRTADANTSGELVDAAEMQRSDASSAGDREAHSTMPGALPVASGLPADEMMRKESSTSRYSASSELFTHSIFGGSAYDESIDEEHELDPTTQAAFGHLPTAGLISDAHDASAAGTDGMPNGFSSRFGGGARTLPPLSNKQRVVGPLAVDTAASRPRAGSSGSSSVPAFSPGANLHMRAGSIRSVQPSLLDSDASTFALGYDRTSTSPIALQSDQKMQQQRDEETFWSTRGDSQFDSAQLSAQTASGNSAALPVQEQLKTLSEGKRRALVRELVQRELWSELKTIAPNDIASAPMLAFLLRGKMTFFQDALAPLLEASRRRQLSAYVDRHGEGDGTRFSAASATQSLTSGIVTLLAEVFASRMGAHAPLQDLPQLDFSSMVFLPYRLPVEQLRNGGFEVDIVASRAATLVLRIRRPSRWDNFIFRSEQHFLALRRNLVAELGPKAGIPILPGTQGEQAKLGNGADAGSIRSSTIESPFANLTPTITSLSSPAFTAPHSDVGHSRTSIPQYADEQPDHTVDFDALSEGHAEGSRPQSRAARLLQHAAFAPPAVTYKIPDVSELRRASASREGIAQWPSKVDMRARADPKKGRIGRNSTSSPPPSIRSNRGSSVAKVSLSLADGEEVPTVERAGRATELRKWLRDVLSVRGVGHSKAMQAFLSSGKMLENDLKKEKPAIQYGISEQEGRVKTRLAAAQRDASSAQDMHDDVAALVEKLLFGGEHADRECLSIASANAVV